MDITEIETTLERMRADTYCLCDKVDEPLKDYLSTLLAYVDALLTTIKLFTKLIAALKGKLEGNRYTMISYWRDVKAYKRSTDRYVELGDAMNAKWRALVGLPSLSVHRHRNSGSTHVEKKHMGWFANWRNKVDIGLRPRNAFEGTEVNLYPFTQRGIEWLEQNIDKFMEPAWSQRDRCLMLSELDCLDLISVVEMLQDVGLKVRFYGRLKGWDGKSPFWLERP